MDRINGMYSMASDIWALGILLMECALGSTMEQLFSSQQAFVAFMNTWMKNESRAALLSSIQAELKLDTTLDESMAQLLDGCLQLRPPHRRTIDQLVDALEQHFPTVPTDRNRVDVQLRNMFCAPPELYHTTIAAVRIDDLKARHREKCSPLDDRPIAEVYSLWRLAGSTVHAQMTRANVIRDTPPICTMPSVVVGDCQSLGDGCARRTHVRLSVVVLCADNVYAKMESVRPRVYSVQRGVSEQLTDGDHYLPIAVKERSIEYQYHRQCLFARLLHSHAHPKCAALLRRESVHDIPPLYRAYVWASMLGVHGDVRTDFNLIDTRQTTQADRQVCGNE